MKKRMIVLSFLILVVALEIKGNCLNNKTPFDFNIEYRGESSKLNNPIQAKYCKSSTIYEGDLIKLNLQNDPKFPITFDEIVFTPKAVTYEIIIDKDKKEIVIREDASKKEVARKKISKRDYLTGAKSEFKNYAEIELAVKNYEKGIY